MKHLTAVLATVGLLLLAGASLAQNASFKVVVHASSSVTSITKAKASQLFLKKATRWETGGKVLAVDQLKRSPVRQAFSEEIHGKNVRAIDSYWQTQIFGGRGTPPPELGSDAQVLSYVRSNAGAIGYVARGATVGKGITVLKIAG